MKNESRCISRVDEDYLKMAAQAVALACEVDAEDVLGRKRPEPLVLARQTAYWLIKRGMSYSFSHTGRMFDRDHGGIMHGVKKVEEVLEMDLTSRNQNGSWAARVKESRANFIRFHETYVESDVHHAMKEAGDAIPAS